ncbi:MAG TPA: biotin-dependent carboxyltransferase family protein [Capsulimonadaceae bacterium]|jgi:antagonist of KipI
MTLTSLRPTMEIVRPGLLTTVQDLGRPGARRDGMIVGGAMDTLAARIANILTGNPQSAAVLEATLLGPTISFHTETVIAIAGADLSAAINGALIPTWSAVPVKSGDTLTFGRRRVGARAYIAVAGGIDVPTVMGSRSTYTRAAIGGFQGRAVAEGDVLAVYSPARNPQRLVGWSAPPDIVDHYTLDALSLPLAILEGPQIDLLTPFSLRNFLEAQFTISSVSDRMGYRLEGPSVNVAAGTHELLSEAAVMGCIQVPPSGSPMLLMADHQTAGGYPVIGVVASVELSHAAQLAPGDTVSFFGVGLADAHDAIAGQENLLRTMEVSARLR